MITYPTYLNVQSSFFTVQHGSEESLLDDGHLLDFKFAPACMFFTYITDPAEQFARTDMGSP